MSTPIKTVLIYGSASWGAASRRPSRRRLRNLVKSSRAGSSRDSGETSVSSSCRRSAGPLISRAETFRQAGRYAEIERLIRKCAGEAPLIATGTRDSIW